MSKKYPNDDVLLDLYTIHAYIPNDENGNPLTPFGNFCEGHKAAWQHQQSRIDDLEAQLAIAVDALEFYDKCDHFINKPDGKVELVDHGCKATEALTRIKQLQEKS